MLAYTNRAVTADQDKRVIKEIVAPTQFPSLAKSTEGDQLSIPQVMRIYWRHCEMVDDEEEEEEEEEEGEGEEEASAS